MFPSTFRRLEVFIAVVESGGFDDRTAQIFSRALLKVGLSVTRF
jgi:hypothetical protein